MAGAIVAINPLKKVVSWLHASPRFFAEPRVMR